MKKVIYFYVYFLHRNFLSENRALIALIWTIYLLYKKIPKTSLKLMIFRLYGDITYALADLVDQDLYTF